MALIFESLTNIHNRNSFNCGEELLNIYLQQFAHQDTRRDLARTFVLRKKESPDVLGYHTLCSGSVEGNELPAALFKKLPRYPVPIVRLARLAVHVDHQDKGYGALLLTDALYRASMAAESVGIHSLLIDAKNENAKRFYQYYGFQPLTLKPLILFAPLKELRKRFTGSS